MKSSDRLEWHSLLLLGATALGHVGNSAYHWISGRLLSDNEYGLLMALFGLVNLLLLPMGALGLSLTRAVTPIAQDGGTLRALLRRWTLLLSASAAALLLLGLACAPLLGAQLGFERLAPGLLAAAIPGLNLLLTLSGSGLQGLQRFGQLALRGSLLFAARAALVGACLQLGYRAAGWALLAHVLGMILALAYSAWALQRALPESRPAPPKPLPPVLRGSLDALPALLAFSALLSLDAPLARRFFTPDIAGQFAQAAVIGRMILWLPLPIAQAMFPKVVRPGAASPAQAHTLRKALLYSGALTLAALAACWVFAPLALRLMYGIASPAPAQIGWLRGMGLAMAPLSLVYLLLQYELACGQPRRLLPLCLCALAYPIATAFHHPHPDALIRNLLFATSAALIAVLLATRVPSRSTP
jgi:O-antigen/teichoic acid export membrane protein